MKPASRAGGVWISALRRVVKGREGGSVNLRRFIAPVATVSGGTAVAQLILLAATPLITRVYGPAEFGGFGVFLSIVMLIGAVGALGYDRAIPLPEDDRDAMAALLVALLAAFAGALLITSIVLVIPFAAPFLAKDWPEAELLWLIPIAVFVQAATLSLQYWFIRRKKYRPLPVSRMATNGGVVVGQLLLGLAAATALDLALGQVFGLLLGLGLLIYFCRSSIPIHELAAARTRVRSAAARYLRFPLFVLPALFLNRGAFYVPTILVGALYGIEAAGLFALSQRLVGAPVELMKQGVSQVLYGESSERARNDPLDLRRQFQALTRVLLILGTAVGIGVAVGAEFLIVPILGAEWEGATRFLQAMALLTPFRAAYASTCQFNAIERQDLYLTWTVIQFAVVVVALAAPRFLGGDATQAVFWYVGGSALIYIMLGTMYSWAVDRFIQERGLA